MLILNACLAIIWDRGQLLKLKIPDIVVQIHCIMTYIRKNSRKSNIEQ